MKKINTGMTLDKLRKARDLLASIEIDDGPITLFPPGWRPWDNWKHLKPEKVMPLIKSSSKKARQENIRREIKAGMKPKQAVAVGYSVQRKAQGKKK